MAHRMTRRTARFGIGVLLLSLMAFGTSVSAQRGRNGGITVFTDPDFRGESATFRNDTPNLLPYGLNDKISSIDIPNGETWEVCQDINYGNRCQVFSGSFSNLRDSGWNDRISSLRRVAGRGFGNGRGRGAIASRGSLNSQALVFYERGGFRGSSTRVTSDEGDLRFIARPGSVQVRGGTWVLCNRSRKCATISDDVSDFSQLGLGTSLDSARLIENGNGVIRRRP